MDLYTAERLLLERQEAVAREAELLSRLLPEGDRSSGFNLWVAQRLRGLADRLDERARFEKAAQ